MIADISFKDIVIRNMNLTFDFIEDRDSDIDFDDTETTVSLNGSILIISFSDNLENYLAKR